MSGQMSFGAGTMDPQVAAVMVLISLGIMGAIEIKHKLQEIFGHTESDDAKLDAIIAEGKALLARRENSDGYPQD